MSRSMLRQRTKRCAKLTKRVIEGPDKDVKIYKQWLHTNHRMNEIFKRFNIKKQELIDGGMSKQHATHTVCNHYSFQMSIIAERGDYLIPLMKKTIFKDKV